MSERELEQRIQRIATDLSQSTGKPLRFWLEETARLIARERHWAIHPTPEGDVVVVYDSPPAASDPASAAPDPSKPG